MEVESDMEMEGANGFNDWETLHSYQYHPSSSSSSHNLSPLRINPHHHDLAIFPPVNHEGLPIPPPPTPPPLHAPLSFLNSDSDSPSSSPSPPPRDSHFAKWFDFALHLWNSKLISVFTHLRSRGLFSVLRPISVTASFLVVLWFWVYRVRRRRRRCLGEESVEQLKRVIKEKDEKIVQLLEQIAQMNKMLLARHRVPVLRPC